jgi:Skp family chaperone for outer membrane proteins
MDFGRSLAGALAVAALLFGAVQVSAQEPVASPILTIDQERLFVESAFGKAVTARETAAAKALEAENARIEAALIAEEQDLTERRASLSAKEFAALADAFDVKVVRIRSEQDAKVRDLTRSREGDRKEFFRAAIPILGELLVERQAVAIVDKEAIVLSLSAIDVTDAAIAKVDQALRPVAVPQGQEPRLEPAPGSPAAPSPTPAP